MRGKQTLEVRSQMSEVRRQVRTSVFLLRQGYGGRVDFGYDVTPFQTGKADIVAWKTGRWVLPKRVSGGSSWGLTGMEGMEGIGRWGACWFWAGSLAPG